MNELTLEQALTLLDESRQHSAAMMNRLYESLGIDDSDGEVRFKLVMVEIEEMKRRRNELVATVEALRSEIQTPYVCRFSREEKLSAILTATTQQHLREVRAEAVASVTIEAYDAGYLNDFGGGNVGWWQDYMRSELGAAHDFYQSQVDQYAHSIRQEK